MTENPGQEIELVVDAEPPELIGPEAAAGGVTGAFTLELPSGHVLRLAHAEPGTIVEEMQAGYMMKDRLLRPAMVAVAKEA